MSDAQALLWTDGSCHPNPGGPGGYAYRLVKGKEILTEGAGGAASTTNNRMEMMAAIAGLKACLGLGLYMVEVRSDSSYLVNCFRQGWWKKWQQNGWRSSSGSPVANPDLWRELITLTQQNALKVVWIHVKGHIGLEHNEACDRMAGEQTRKFATQAVS